VIGTTISHYRILDKLGEGGMGVVYRAHDTRLERDVAVKVLPAGTLADDAARKRFRREALALSKARGACQAGQVRARKELLGRGIWRK
jgi:serine/threonine protein kinase